MTLEFAGTRLNRAGLFTSVRFTVFGGGLSQPQVDGINFILDAWEAAGFSDLRWLAYMLGTSYHETAHAMRPVKEFGSDAYYTRMYDISGERPDKARALGNLDVGDGARYCGRGYVQLTGKANYARMGRILNIDLVGNPDVAMNPIIAARIMFAGMTATNRGDTFSGVNLQRYFNEVTEDWVNARRVINGLDHADMIAETAQRFHAGLAMVAAVERPPPPVSLRPPPPVAPTVDPWWKRMLRW